MQGARTSARQRKTLAWNGRELVTAAGLQRTAGGRGAGEATFCSRVACRRLAMQGLRPDQWPMRCPLAIAAWSQTAGSVNCVLDPLCQGGGRFGTVSQFFLLGFRVDQRQMLCSAHITDWTWCGIGDMMTTISSRLAANAGHGVTSCFFRDEWHY